MSKELKISQDILNEIKLIAAKANAKSVNSFLEDLFGHWILGTQQGITPSLTTIIKQERTDGVKIGLRIADSVLYDLRILAAEANGTSLKAYMEAILIWLAEEHRNNGRVWIDDTDVRVLPIRTRK